MAIRFRMRRRKKQKVKRSHLFLNMAQIWQINLHHSKNASDNLLSEVIGQITPPIILIQEPYLYKKKVKLYLPNYNLYFVGLNSRSVIAIPKLFKGVFLRSLSDRDTTAVLLEENNDKPVKFVLVSAYLDILDKEVVSKGLERISRFSSDKNLPLVLGIDSNAHSTLWGCDDDNQRGKTIEEWLILNNLAVVNTGYEPTFVTSRAETIIDITLVSEPILGDISNWFVNKSYQFSDHRRLEFTLNFSSTNIVYTRNYKTANWQKFRTLLNAAKPWNPPLGWTRQVLDKEVTNFLDWIKDALELTCPIRMINFTKVKKTWWTNRLLTLKRYAKRLHRKFRNNRSEANHEQFKEARKKYSDAISVAKMNAWKGFCDSIQDIKSFSKVSKSLTSDSRINIGQLRKGNGDVTNDVVDMLNTLMDDHFPGSKNVDDVPDSSHGPEYSNNFLRDAGFVSHISEDKVKEAIMSFSSFKAAGLDGCKPIVLQNLPDSALERLTLLFKASTALRYNPKEWCKSRVIFIPKQGKTDYDSTKSFRPISLTSFFFKTLEKVQKWEIEDKYLRSNPMHKHQYAFQKGKSTEAALAKVVDFIEAGLLRSGYSLGVFLDISGAFDNIRVESIIKGFKRKNISESITGWFESSLRNRVAETSLDGFVVKRSLTKGTAQGGVISTIAWNLAIDDILHELNKPPFLVVGFADDFSILINGICPDTMVQLMQPVLDMIEQKGKACGVAFNAKKTEVVMFTNKRKKTFQKLKVNGFPVEYGVGAKYLGVFLDSKLTMQKHIDDKISKCKKHLFALKNVIGKNWGVSPWLLKWSYTGIVRPKLTYACHIWQHRINKTTKVKLERLNRLACLNIAQVHRSTPTKGMEIIYNLPPLDLIVQRVGVQTYLRIRSQINTHWDGIGNCRNGFLFQSYNMATKLGVYGLPTDQIMTHKNWVKKFHTLDFEEYKNCSSESNNTIYCYTDGSKIKDSMVGCGFIIKKASKCLDKHQESLGSIATVFQAEILAILRASQALQKRVNQKITIRSDSQAAIQALRSKDVESNLVLECIRSLNRLGKKNKLVLQWIKAHVGHLGNEEADYLARSGAEMKMLGPEPFLPVPGSYIKRQTKLEFEKSWNNRWQNLETCRQTKIWFAEASNKMDKALRHFSRSDLSKLIQFITGHCNLNRHISLQDKGHSPLCRHCKDSEETPWHLVTSCPSFFSHRRNIFHGQILYSIDWSPRQLHGFCKESSIWSMLDRQ